MQTQAKTEKERIKKNGWGSHDVVTQRRRTGWLRGARLPQVKKRRYRNVVKSA